ncbi:MAG: DUF3037 domain-containing protein [Pseudomonadota bacterium]
MKSAFTYVILRYRHDAVADERVNVGIVLHCAEEGFLGVKLSPKYGRLRQLFPDLDPSAYRESIRSIERAVTQLKRVEKGDMLSRLVSANELARQALPTDDSSFVWGDVGSGISQDPKLEIEKLFKRFVTWYEQDKSYKRSDGDVWRPVREKLQERNIPVQLEKKTVSSKLTSVEFEHTWKNGQLHCYQPLSFDLASADSIQEKAMRWSGHLLHLTEAREDFVPYFIVGEPANVSLKPAYKKAMQALIASPNNPKVYTEGQLDELVDSIEDEVRDHNEQPTRSRS